MSAVRDSAAQSLAHALRIAEVAGVTLVQPMFVLAATFSHMRVPTAVPIVLHGIAFALGAIAYCSRLSPAWLIGATYVACLVDLLVADDDRQLIFTAAFIILVLAAVVPILIWEGRAPLYVAAGVVAVAYAPAGDATTALRMLLAIAALAVAVTVLMNGVRGFARMIDAEEAVTREAERVATAQRARAETTAEYARVLHDTVINTFALLAREAHGEDDCDLIRERCRHNLERVGELRAGSSAPRRRRSLVDLEHTAGVRIEWIDDARAVIRDAEPTLPADMARAVFDCVGEAVTNARKHAGVDHVFVEVRVDVDEMVVIVRDEGRGFDGQLIPRRGLAESLFARAAEHGIQVGLRTAPGRGTTVEFHCPTRTVEAYTGSFVASGVRQGRAVLARAALVWSLVIHGASVVIAAMDPEVGPISLAASAAIVFGLTLAFWLVMRAGRHVPGWLTVVTLVLVPFIAWLGYEAGDQAHSLGGAFPPLLVTGVCVFLLVMRPDRKAFVAASALIFVGLTTTILVHAHSDAEFAAHGIIMQIPVLGMLFAWYLLHEVFLGLIDRMRSMQERRSLMHHQRAVAESAQTLWEQWSDAGLEASLQILRDIGEGRTDPGDPELRSACHREENHLRQVCAIASGGVLMSWWFARALSAARAHQVELRLQVEGVDVADQHEAAALGNLIVSVVQAAEQRTIVTATLMADHDENVSLTLVSSAVLRARELAANISLQIVRYDVGEQTLITASRVPSQPVTPYGDVTDGFAREPERRLFGRSSM